GDPDGDALTFSVVSGPQGLTIDPASGLVTWTPAADQAGDSNQVNLQVSDGRLTATQTYVVCVDQQVGNHPPVIISTPLTTYSMPGSGSTLTGPPPSDGLVLTAVGAAAGFSLTEFAAGLPSSNAHHNVQFGNLGPMGIDFTDDDGVVVTDSLGNVRRFPTDNDGQNANTVTPGQSYGDDNANSVAHVGNNLYLTRYNHGDVIQINPDGTFNQ